MGSSASSRLCTHLPCTLLMLVQLQLEVIRATTHRDNQVRGLLPAPASHCLFPTRKHDASTSSAYTQSKQTHPIHSSGKEEATAFNVRNLLSDIGR
ncbi:hypothetical protein M440DRAFT_1398603 [Trichoderma longibrachiatum ATCC 18648]|uniref:Secreted protein n=1 Tax=Trichoderma longibrachiatum ATCC 18648 TaxID=983965 RepID=A0A2T4CCU3_TRILO|nr:hypothetical protein M440DRAFT_1398603 [Trichoderma longibrachiatum ATCC 18648]